MSQDQPSPSLQRAREALQATYGYPDFRPAQRGIVERIVDGQCLLAVLPTGGGKSICYQIPALVKPGLTIVVSPLIALMKDQVDALHRLKLPAAAYHSSLSRGEQQDIVASIAAGTLKFLYVSPERFHDGAFVEFLRSHPIGLLAIDEAHCISQWGHDFRPSYQRLSEAVEALGRPQVVALTATATPEVRADIQRQLGIPPANLIVAGFDRPNLTYIARACHTAAERRAHLQHLARRLEGTGIIYAPTRRGAEDTSLWLTAQGIETTCYHAGLSDTVRAKAQDDWLSGKSRLIAATNAFGMGIDKPDVRFVLHYQAPGSLEAYYQEAGRAGRDGEISYAVLLYGESDRRIHERFLESRFPSREVVEAVFRSLQGAPAATPAELARRFPRKWGEPLINRSLKLLSEAGIVALATNTGSSSQPIRCLEQSGLDAGDLPIDWNELERGYQVELAKLDAVLAYGPETGCRRTAVLRYFGEETGPTSCSRCDNCLAWHGAAQRTREPTLPLETLILQAVRTLGGRFGETTVAAFLAGASTQKTRRFHFDRLPGYGILSNMTQTDIRQEIRKLLLGKLLWRRGIEHYRVVQLTQEGKRRLDCVTPDLEPLRADHVDDIGQRGGTPRSPQDPMALLEGLARAAPPARQDSYLATYTLLAAGMDLGTIAARRGIRASTVVTHLEMLLKRGHDVDVDQYLPLEHRYAIERCLDDDPQAPLTDLKRRLPEEITYDEIRLVRAAWDGRPVRGRR